MAVWLATERLVRLARRFMVSEARPVGTLVKVMFCAFGGTLVAEATEIASLESLPIEESFLSEFGR